MMLNLISIFISLLSFQHLSAAQGVQRVGLQYYLQKSSPQFQWFLKREEKTKIQCRASLTPALRQIHPSYQDLFTRNLDDIFEASNEGNPANLTALAAKAFLINPNHFKKPQEEPLFIELSKFIFRGTDQMEFFQNFDQDRVSGKVEVLQERLRKIQKGSYRNSKLIKFYIFDFVFTVGKFKKLYLDAKTLEDLERLRLEVLKMKDQLLVLNLELMLNQDVKEELGAALLSDNTNARELLRILLFNFE